MAGRYELLENIKNFCAPHRYLYYQHFVGSVNIGKICQNGKHCKKEQTLTFFLILFLLYQQNIYKKGHMGGKMTASHINFNITKYRLKMFCMRDRRQTHTSHPYLPPLTEAKERVKEKQVYQLSYFSILPSFLTCYTLPVLSLLYLVLPCFTLLYSVLPLPTLLLTYI